MNGPTRIESIKKAIDRPAVAAAVGLVGGAILFFPEVRGLLLSALPFLILLLCPLMHVFMHRGHGGHGDGGRDIRHFDAAEFRGAETVGKQLEQGIRSKANKMEDSA
jgi:hypothetical protein